jgi:hypothetical protein
MERILRIGRLGIKNNGGVNLTILYCKQFCKCHCVNSVQQHNDKKNKNKAIYHVKQNMELEVVTDNQFFLGKKYLGVVMDENECGKSNKG